jgi:UPF0755 protein
MVNMRTALGILLLLALAAAEAWYLLLYPAGPKKQHIVEIEPGSSAWKIGRQLQNEGILRSSFAFALWARHKRGTLKAGAYSFDHPASLLEVYGRLRAGDVYTVTLTVPEGYNIFDIAQAAQQAGLASRSVFLAEERKDTDLIHDLDPQAQSLEGYLFPDTYQLNPMASPRQVLATMVRRFRAEAKELGITAHVHETVTLASLVERETPASEDRPLVAGVFVNRMARGMPLDTDPSVIYAALLENRYRGTIYASDLQADSSYNTYMHAGLPPGPICNPGDPSLRAALHPAHTDYLYFVSDPEHPGHSRFAATLAEHDKNVSVYRNAQHRAAASNTPAGEQ